MKYFIVADVHGFFTELKEALDAAGFNPADPNHVFVSLGDLLDRGRQPKECLDYVLSLPEDRRIFIRGNHEDLMEAAIIRVGFYPNDKSNGTIQTTQDIVGAGTYHDNLIGMRFYKPYNDYIRETRDFYETQNYIFVHGWIPHFCYAKGFNCDYHIHDYDENWREADIEDWCEARWHNGMESWADGVREPGKTICCGHFHTSWGHCYIHGDQPEWPRKCDPEEKVREWNPPFIDKGIIALDTCTVLTHKVNCVVVEDEPI